MTIDVEAVAALVAAAVGEPVSVSRVPGSVANQDFVVTLADGRRVVVKTGPAAEIAAESWVCRQLPAIGVPVPHVLAADHIHAGFPYLILTFVDGEPSDDPAVARQAGAALRRVHGLELPGWGPLVVVDGGGAASGRYGSMRDAVRAELAGLPGLVAAGLLDPGVAETVRELVDVAEMVTRPGPGVLLHNDLKPAHLFGLPDGAPTRLTAIIDWGDARVGDPLADLARLSMSGPALTGAVLDGYGLRAGPRLEDRMARYRLLWNVGALTYEHRAGGDWFAVYQERILDDVTALSR